MLRTLLARLTGRLGRDGDESSNEAVETDADDSEGFVRSRLDADVVTAHGDGNPDAERELADVTEQARTLEEGRDG